MSISDWSSDVCSSDLPTSWGEQAALPRSAIAPPARGAVHPRRTGSGGIVPLGCRHRACGRDRRGRSEEHTSELQSLMRISYAVFCLKKNKRQYKLEQLTDVINRLPNICNTSESAKK